MAIIENVISNIIRENLKCYLFLYMGLLYNPHTAEQKGIEFVLLCKQ